MALIVVHGQNDSFGGVPFEVTFLLNLECFGVSAALYLHLKRVGNIGLVFSVFIFFKSSNY